MSENLDPTKHAPRLTRRAVLTGGAAAVGLGAIGRTRPVLAQARPGGTLAFVHATTHQGVDPTTDLPHPRPPRKQIEDLIVARLGPRRRAGQGYRRPDSATEEERGTLETGYLQRAGFGDRRRFAVPGWVVTRTEDEVVASVFSLSYAAPHLFGDEVTAFEQEVQAVKVPGGTVGREKLLARLGVVALVLGIAIGVLGYAQSFSADDVAAAQRDAVVLAAIGVSVSILGLALFLRYSLGALLRLWLARLVADRESS